MGKWRTHTIKTVSNKYIEEETIMLNSECAEDLVVDVWSHSYAFCSLRQVKESFCFLTPGPCTPFEVSLGWLQSVLYLFAALNCNRE